MGYAIIISMNEGGDSSKALQVQGNTSQSMRPVSAVGAGFDANRLGNGQELKKIKKIKNNIGNNFMMEVDKANRPIWFWIVLGILGLVIVGALIWMVIVLTMHDADTNGNDSLVELELEDNTEGNPVEGGVIANYVAQLQRVYDTNNAEAKEGEAANASSNASQAVSKIVEKALSTKRGSSQVDSIKLAELIVARDNSDDEKAKEILSQINPDALSIKDQINYYAIAESIYRKAGNGEEAQEAFSKVQELTRQLCNIQECTQ